MYDFIIKGGRIIEGSSNPWYYGDIAIQGDKIAEIGKFNNSYAKEVIDASDRVICPGFIDMHSHSDVMLLANPTHKPKVMQGVTTDVIGLDGLSYAPLSSAHLKMMRRYLSGLNGDPNISWDWNSVREFLNRFDHKVSINVAYLVPHNALRLGSMGFVDRKATSKELDKMKLLMAHGMEQGAIGFSTGLDYFPARYSNIEELVAICEVVAKYNGISVWHVRNRDLGLINATDEAIAVGKRSGAKIHLSHYSANTNANKGKSKQLIEMIDRARNEGIDITYDSYPYTTVSTTLILYLPRWVHEGGPNSILSKLSNKNTKKRICAEMDALKLHAKMLIIASVINEKNKKFIGKNFVQCAQMSGKSVPEFVCDLLLEEQLEVSYVGFIGNEDDMQVIMKHPCHTACSDGLLIGDKPSPRGWGTFPRYLAVYNRERGILSLEEMIRHMTSASAQRLGLTDRGLIKKDLAADLVIFDPKTIRDQATFDQPKKYPTGIDYVMVNGAFVVKKGLHTEIFNGRVLPID